MCGNSPSRRLSAHIDSTGAGKFATAGTKAIVIQAFRRHASIMHVDVSRDR